MCVLSNKDKPLARKRTPLPAQGPTGVLWGWAFSYGRGTPVPALCAASAHLSLQDLASHILIDKTSKGCGRQQLSTRKGFWKATDASTLKPPADISKNLLSNTCNTLLGMTTSHGRWAQRSSIASDQPTRSVFSLESILFPPKYSCTRLQG